MLQLRGLSSLSFLSENKVSAEAPHRKVDEFVPGTAGSCTSTVEISISCRHLANKDVLSKSDPMCAVFFRPPGSKAWVPLMRTETIENDLNPDFAAKVTMEYSFETVQALRFEIYDVDSDSASLNSQDTLGFVETSLAQIVCAGVEGLTLELTGMLPTLIPQEANKPNETIILTAEELASEKDEILLRMVGVNCGTWSACLPPKTYFAVSKCNDAGKYLVVYRSPFARGSSPVWKPMKVSSRALCNGDHDRFLKLEVYQTDMKGQNYCVGYALTTLDKMLNGEKNERTPLYGPDGTVSQSAVKLVQCTLTPINTFLDYVKSGMEIHCCFAIDFTCSNGDPDDCESLHYIPRGGNSPNPYEQAIHSVGTIVSDYDKSNLFPAYGFGARIPPLGEPSHCFHLTLEKSPNCSSIPGLLETYRSCIRKVGLYAPTYFAPVIKTVATMASKVKQGQHYYILVIVTDGVISDMAKTKRAIIDACSFPMSIIIIGVGEADFRAMEELDGDAVRLSVGRKVASRDIVQFVAYRSARAWMSATGESTTEGIGLSMADEGGGEEDSGAEAAAAAPPSPPEPPEGTEEEEVKTNRLAESQLAKEVLCEIPDQLRGYMMSKGITPDMIKLLKAPKKEAESEEVKE